MIIEGLCTTLNLDGAVNIAPMGPVVDEQLTSFLFRPFQTSTTFANLKATRCGVFHVTDNVEQIARAAVGMLTERPELIPAQVVAGSVIANACRWYEFEVTTLDDSRERSEIQTRIVHTGHIRDFWGFNRAKHAVLETAILATRLGLIPPEDIQQQLSRLSIIVDKTAGDQEFLAFRLLSEFIQTRLGQQCNPD